MFPEGSGAHPEVVNVELKNAITNVVPAQAGTHTTLAL
jgi:hypothetical protein